MLEAAAADAQAESVAAATDFGLSAVRGERAKLADAERLRAWLRASLNQRALGARLLALYRQQRLLASWYTRGAALRIEDVAAIVLGLLPALDAVPFQLSIDPASPGTPAVPAAAASAAASQQSAAAALATQPAAGSQLPKLRQPDTQQAADGAPAGTQPSPMTAAAGAPGPAAPPPNGGFLASFGGLLGRRGSPVAATASPGKGNRRVVAIADGGGKSPGSPAAPQASGGSGFATPAGSGMLSPVSSIDIGNDMQGMRGAEPLSPATLAYFANAAAQPRILLTGPPAEASPAGDGGRQSASNPLPSGLLAADMLSPFQSGAPSPLALLQALQAEADMPSGDAGGAEVAPADLDFLAQLLQQPGPKQPAQSQPPLRLLQPPDQGVPQQAACAASRDAMLSPMRSVSSLEATAVEGDFAQLLQTAASPLAVPIPGGKQRGANRASSALVSPGRPQGVAAGSHAGSTPQPAVAEAPAPAPDTIRVQLMDGGGSVQLQLQMVQGPQSSAAQPAVTAEDTAADYGSAAATIALARGKAALDAATASVPAAGSAAGGGGNPAVDAAAATERSGSVSSLSDVSDAAAAALQGILRPDGNGGSGTSSPASASGSASSSVSSSRGSEGSGLSADSELDGLDLPGVPQHRVATATAPAAAAAASRAAAGGASRLASAPTGGSSAAAPAAKAAAAAEPDAADLSYSDITAMLAAGLRDPPAALRKRRERGSSPGTAAAPAAAPAADAAAGSCDVGVGAAEQLGGTLEAAQAKEAAQLRQYLADNGIELSDDDSTPAGDVMPSVPGAARIRDARRDLFTDLLTAAALDAAAGGGGGGDWSADAGPDPAASADGGLLDDMSQVLMGFHGGRGRRSLDASSEASGSARDLGSSLSASTAAAAAAFSPAGGVDGAAAVPFEVTSVRVVRADSRGEGRRQHTAYILAVEAEGGRLWEVARRFSDFQALRSALAGAAPGGLPPSWTHLSRARSVTGASRLTPEVVAARTALLERCLAELLAAAPAVEQAGQAPQGGQPLRAATAFLAFLQPRRSAAEAAKTAWKSPLQWVKQRAHGSSPASSEGAAAAEAAAAAHAEPLPGYGGSMRLLTDLPPARPVSETLLMQGGACAGCRAVLPPPAGRSSAVLGSGSKGPRLCEYTGGLFCRRCHSGRTARLPGRALHSWDFTPRPVCDNAAEFLAATYRQPLLAVSAVAPGLYARVPTLAHAHELRMRAARALAAARNAGPATAAKVERLLGAAGPKRHLLEGADFWALSELADLGGGAFARMPPWLEAAAGKAADLAAAALLEVPQGGI